MHYDPLISSRAKALVSWGHDWVVLCILVANPSWAPAKVFALPVAVRLYRNRQGLTKGKKKAAKGKEAARLKHDPSHRTRPELALELIGLVARWFPDDEVIVSGDSAYGGRSILSKLPPTVHLISHVHPKGALYEPAPLRVAKTKGRAPKRGKRLPTMKQWAEDLHQRWTRLEFDQFGLHATLAVKTIGALYYKAGGDRLLTIVLVRDPEGKRPDQMFYCTKLDWTARQILSTYACRWAIECTFENCKQLLGLEDPANRLPKAVARTAPLALMIYSMIVVWFHQAGHRVLRFPLRPWYRRKEEPSFADMLTTLRRVSYEEKTHGLVPERCRLKAWISQLTELLSRAG
jgi:hypothetical protein